MEVQILLQISHFTIRVPSYRIAAGRTALHLASVAQSAGQCCIVLAL